MTRTFRKEGIESDSTETEQDPRWLQALVHCYPYDTSTRSWNSSISCRNKSVESFKSTASIVTIIEASDMNNIGNDDVRRYSQQSHYSGRTMYEDEMEKDKLYDCLTAEKGQTRSSQPLSKANTKQVMSSDRETSPKRSRDQRVDIPSRRSSRASRSFLYSSSRPPSYQNTRHFQSIDGTLNQIRSARESSIASERTNISTASVKSTQESPPPQRRIRLERSLSLPPPPTHTTLITTLPPRQPISPPPSRSNVRHSNPTYYSTSQNTTSPQTHSLPTSTRHSLALSRPSSPTPILPDISTIPTSETLILDWTSPETRRAEYAKIDQCHSGLRGLWKRVMPKCMHHRRARRGFWDEGNGKAWDADTDSVRRFRVAIGDDDDNDSNEEEGEEYREKRRST